MNDLLLVVLEVDAPDDATLSGRLHVQIGQHLQPQVLQRISSISEQLEVVSNGLEYLIEYLTVGRVLYSYHLRSLLWFFLLLLLLALLWLELRTLIRLNSLLHLSNQIIIIGILVEFVPHLPDHLQYLLAEDPHQLL